MTQRQQIIYKYALMLYQDLYEIVLPADSKPLSVQTQNIDGDGYSHVQVWVQLPRVQKHEDNADLETATFQFYTVGTGHLLPDDIDTYEYLSTWQIENGALVFHTYWRKAI